MQYPPLVAGDYTGLGGSTDIPPKFRNAPYARCTSRSPPRWATIVSIAEKIGCTPEALRKWVQDCEIDRGDRTGKTTYSRYTRDTGALPGELIREVCKERGLSARSF